MEVVDEQTGVAKNVTMDRDDIGSFEACHKFVQLVLAKDAYVLFRKIHPFDHQHIRCAICYQGQPRQLLLLI